MICKCGKKLSYGEIPNPIEWLIISDVEYDGYQGMIDSEGLYQKMKSMIKCNQCGRMWIFWHGFDKDPTCYILE